ncbi:MAG: glutathione synthase [Azospirillum brasilense]|nr:MAG: glutathione synthase [Azospirillum brasilense]
MKVAFQMDHPSRLNLPMDTTIMLIEEAQKRGMQCYMYEPHQLSWRAGVALARMQPLQLAYEDGQLRCTLGEASLQPLASMHAVWMRQDPPFDMHYITATHLLEHAGTRVFNDPVGVRNAPEKLAALHLQDCMPPTLVSNDVDMVHDFAAQHGQVVAKPLHGYGGRSVYKFRAGDANIDTLLEQNREAGGQALMWQAFLPEVATGDVRILLVEGEIAAIFQREPQGESIRANMRVGGIAKPIEVNDRHRAICARIAPMLKAQGLMLVGLDMIGDYLTEINVTSPTGLRAAQQLYGLNIAADIWDRIG